MRINDDDDEVPCHCTVGEDHDDRDPLSDEAANNIWLSSGKDEDYDFRR